jgi:UDP-glucose 4-epimerase
MKVLITGGVGFIGSHLAEAYLTRGDEVHIIDNLATATLQNIKHLQEDARFHGRLFVVIDSVLNYDTMLDLVGMCDVVVHLAAAVGVRYILDNPLSSIATNVQGTEVVLQLCDKFKKRVLIASTSEVYGKHDHSPLVETDDCVYGPSTKSRWSYAASKLMNEFTALGYYRTHKLPVCIVRLFNTVGPRQTGRYGMVTPRFVTQALKNDPITVYGDGSQTRTFMHVNDAVRAIMRLLETSVATGQVVNIGGVEEVSIRDLAVRVKKIANSNSPLKLIPYDEVYPADFDDMQRRVPSVEKLRSLIGHSPMLDLDQILVDIVAYHRSLPPHAKK